MNRICLFFILTAFSFSAFAQKDYKTKLGSKTLYQPLQTNYAKVPNDYNAVYINYIGRHGARHLSKDVKVSFAYKILRKADSLNMLSDEGLVLRKKVANLDKVEEKVFASISKIGAEELEGIALRMYENQKDVFIGTTTPLLVSTTKKGRTKESAEAFLVGLKNIKASILENVKFNYADDDHLRFYDFSKSYDAFKEKGPWISIYKELAAINKLSAIADQFSKKIFKTGFYEKLNTEEKNNIIEDIYGFYTILNAIKNETDAAKLTSADLNFKDYFNAAELKSLGILGDAEDFLTKGPGTNANGIQVRIAAPLLADFINTSENFLKNGTIKADLRFAHAETIAPFAAIMGIKGASESVKDIKNFEQVWQAEKVIPFSANIQWIFYKNKKTGQFLVKFMLNEKEVGINGLSTKTYPYYNWIAIRAFYMNKLKGLKLNLQDDMHSYLLNVK